MTDATLAAHVCVQAGFVAAVCSARLSARPQTMREEALLETAVLAALGEDEDEVSCRCPNRTCFQHRARRYKCVLK